MYIYIYIYVGKTLLVVSLFAESKKMVERGEANNWSRGPSGPCGPCPHGPGGPARALMVPSLMGHLGSRGPGPHGPDPMGWPLWASLGICGSGPYGPPRAFVGRALMSLTGPSWAWPSLGLHGPLWARPLWARPLRGPLCNLFQNVLPQIGGPKQLMSHSHIYIYIYICVYSLN